MDTLNVDMAHEAQKLGEMKLTAKSTRGRLNSLALFRLPTAVQKFGRLWAKKTKTDRCRKIVGAVGDWPAYQMTCLTSSIS